MIIEPDRHSNSECVGYAESDQDSNNPENDTVTAERAIQPFLGVVKDLKVLMLADGGADGQRWPRRKVFQRSSQTEQIFEYCFLHNGVSIILVPLFDVPDADYRGPEPNEEHPRNNEIHASVTSDLQQTRSNGKQTAVQSEVVGCPIPVQPDFKTILFDGDFIEGK